MKSRFPRESGVVGLRNLLAIGLCLIGTAFLLPSLGPMKRIIPPGRMLAYLRIQVPQPAHSTAARNAAGETARLGIPRTIVTDTPTFGHPVISGIGGTGFEQSIRLDPSDPNRVYTSAPGSASADTSWIWHSLDGGKTFKWVVGAAPLEGKVTTCHGGGDTELAVDGFGRLYFNDLTLANFSTSRSDDGGATFTCSSTGVPDTAVDRQWYGVHVRGDRWRSAQRRQHLLGER